MGCASSMPKLSDGNIEKRFYLEQIDGINVSERIFEIVRSATYSSEGEEIVAGIIGKRNIVTWSPKSGVIKGIVLISHGLHEHSLRYYSTAQELVLRGFIVYSIDHVGHGMSEGSDIDKTKGLIEDYKILINDFMELAKIAREENFTSDTIPISILSHSMGTLVAMLAWKEISDVNCIVCSGTPIFAGHSASSPFGIKMLYPLSQSGLALSMAKLMSSLDPKGPCAPIEIDAISSSQTAKQILLRDHRQYHGDIMNQTAHEVLKMIEACKKEIPHINVPMFIIHGTADTIALPKGSQYLYDNISTVEGDKKLKMCPELRHEVFHERKPDGPAAIKSVVDYIDSMVHHKSTHWNLDIVTK